MHYHGLGDRVSLPGNCDTLEQWYPQLDAFVLPSLTEGMPLTVLEALACGTPVIAFPEGAACEIVVDGVNGFLVADEEAMAAAVADLGSIDAAVCRTGVAQRYDVARVTAAYERVYRATAAGGLFASPSKTLEVAR